MSMIANISSIITLLMFIIYIIGKVYIGLTESVDNHIIDIKLINGSANDQRYIDFIESHDFKIGNELENAIEIEFDVPLRKIKLLHFEDDMLKYCMNTKNILKEFTNNRCTKIYTLKNVPKHTKILVYSRLPDVIASDVIEYTTNSFITFKYLLFENGKSGSFNKENAQIKITPSFIIKLIFS